MWTKTSVSTFPRRALQKKKATEVKKYNKTGLVERISDSEYEETGDEELLISKYRQQKTRKTVILETTLFKF